ncbi:helix-turn-helix domain-containing protein [Streptomyces luteogriseus]|uniref:helix-turn-helix domain-containing protein n=1 Tax=Streptomyces luteogriseus TaxID=68233 RepID=UPI00378AB74C
MAEKQKTPMGPVGEALMHNIKRIREGQRLTFVKLSEELTEIGRPIPILGLRRIERGERRVDAEELLALAYVLGVQPVDLLVPPELEDEASYSIAPTVQVTAGAARDWISGVGFLPSTDVADMARALQWMPKSRQPLVAARWLQQTNKALGKEQAMPGWESDG